MALFSMNADIETTTLEDLTETVRAFMLTAMTRAVKAYLRAALSKIPVRTGFLRGSFQNLESFFREFGAGYLQGSTPRLFEFYYPPSGGRILKTPDSGVRFTTPPQEVMSIQGDTIIINIDSNINYYAINDFGRSIHGGGWHSIEAGTVAFYNHLESELNNFPDIQSIFSTFRIRVSESNITTKTIPPDVSGRTLILRAFF